MSVDIWRRLCASVSNKRHLRVHRDCHRDDQSVQYDDRYKIYPVIWVESIVCPANNLGEEEVSCNINGAL